MSHFKPQTRSMIADPYGDNNSRMEGAKSSFTAGIMASESCMGKCDLNRDANDLSA